MRWVAHKYFTIERRGEIRAAAVEEDEAETMKEAQTMADEVASTGAIVMVGNSSSPRRHPGFIRTTMRRITKTNMSCCLQVVTPF
mmetsp:Transcript_7443/g.15995  ORF Transcript_7443/g.15995 Transcript_7443/m.15995 type:complete len:85 (+) Transcript_7443:236-490(+)